MERHSAVTTAILAAACAGSPARPVPPPSAAEPPVAAPAPAPAAAPMDAPIVVADAEPRFVFRDPARRTRLAAAFPAIDKRIEGERTGQGVPGLAVGIVIDGELAYAKGFGVVRLDAPAAPDADTVYRIGSITKSFTGLALLALRDEGALELDDPLAKWIPEAARLVYPTRDARPLTLRQLATHTSGLPRMAQFMTDDAPSEDAIVKELRSLALETAPGTRFTYSNLGFGLLGIAVAHAAKLPYHDVIASRLLTPLGMAATVWDPARVPAGRLAPAHEHGPKGPTVKPEPARLGAIDGAGALYSSVRDMAKYVALQLAAYPARNADDAGPLRRATLREAHGTGVPAGFEPEPPTAMSYGFGWGREASCGLDDRVGHNGAIDSYRAEIAFSPSRGVGVIVLSNFGMANTRAYVDAVFEELHDTGALVPREVEPSPLLQEAATRLLAIYHQWDEAALAAALARPIDPREQAELATYKQLHGACTTLAPLRFDGSRSGVFAVACERGRFELSIAVDAHGKIDSFFGFSRDVAPPPDLARAAKAVVGLIARWDDRVFAKHLAKGALPAARMKALASEFHAKHGACKLGTPIHEGFDWGYELACARGNVELYLTTLPQDASQIVGMNLRKPRGAAPGAACD